MDDDLLPTARPLYHEATYQIDPALIMTRRRASRFWEAFLRNSPGVWEAGASEREAVGALLLRIAREQGSYEERVGGFS